MDPVDAARLAAVARGDEAADLVLRGARVLNVFTSELERVDVAIADGRIAGLDDGYEGRASEDVSGRVLLPGLMDAHIHLESTLLSPAAFAEMAVPRGTTAVVMDPHEIGNVLGPAGVRALLDAARDLPLDVFATAPSCVPVLPEESTGGRDRGG